MPKKVTGGIKVACLDFDLRKTRMALGVQVLVTDPKELETLATTLGSREQLAIAEFADALLVIPKTLANNAAKDAVELTAKLRAIHNIAQSDPSKRNLQSRGLDLVNGSIRDNMEAGVLE